MAKKDDTDILALIPDLSVPQLLEIIKAAESARAQKIEAEKTAFLDRIRAEAQKLGLSLESLIAAPVKDRWVRGTGTRQSPAPKYKFPDGTTWAGRGRSPKALQALEAEGRDRKEFLIDRAA